MSVRDLCTQTRIAWQGDYLAESMSRFHGQYVVLTNRESCRVLVTFHTLYYLLIIPRARMGSESIAHEAKGRMGY